jgi:hypothetical protein
VAGVLRSVIPELDLRSWKTVDYRLKALPDHLLILALHQRGLPGLVTCDEEMLELPEVLAVVKQVAFHLVVCTRTGHDAIAATGLLLYHLPHVAKRYQARRPQIWRLTARESIPEKRSRVEDSLYRRKGLRVSDHLLAEEELGNPVIPET